MNTKAFRFIFIMMMVICIGSGIKSIFTISVNNDKINDRNKYFTSIVIKSGDTLDSISLRYLSDDYESAEDYRNEVIRINHLNEEGDIHVGGYLVVPYFDSIEQIGGL